MKVLHILDHYKPHFSGYVFRTSYILKYQRECGVTPVLLTSPKQGEASSPVEEIDGMRVYRTLETDFGSTPFIKERKLMGAVEKRIAEAVEAEKPDIIHAHSPSLNGIPALSAARKYGIPVVYEVRAFWEDAAVDHGTFKEKSIKYRVSKFMETRLFKGVDAIFTICDGLRKDIVSRGVPGEKVTIIPNCVDTGCFSPLGYGEEVASRHGLKGKVVFGFIGSFYRYEGLDLLIESFPKVQEKVKGARLLLVGDGPEKQRLYEKAVRMNLLRYITFTGKVAHSEVNTYYSIVDVLVYPRKSMRLTELVTPLKPLEAMAMGKIVAGSDVGGIKELVTDKKDGFLFKAGDSGSLSDLLIDLARRKEGLSETSKAAIETVHAKHNWKSAVERYLPVYGRLTGKGEFKCAG
ncbi:MAG: glycosyltransferase, exosortase A system-associated [Deltaproteobacteria bacterium]|nr:glycosyltransferase, exosortase A system-associated [Deltaproteobacteria bacterium]